MNPKERIPTIVWVGLVFLAGLSIGYLTIFSENPLTGTVTSSVGNFTVNIVSTIACTISTEDFNVSFGDSVSNNIYGVNASMNYRGYLNSQPDAANLTRYNVTATSTNTVNVNFTISGADLVILGGQTFWRIAVGNVTWNSTTNRTFASTNGTTFNSNGLNSTFYFPGKRNLSTSFQDGASGGDVGANLAAGTTVWLRYWLTVPSGQLAGIYTGNHTTQCTDAT